MSSQRLKRLFPIALIASLAACSGGSQSPSQALPAVADATPNTLTPMSTATSAPASYSTSILSDHPAAFYPLDDAKPTAHDQSGNNLNGTIGSSITTGVTGLATSSKADQFPGVQSAAGAIKVAESSLLQPATTVSLESLFRFSAAPTNYAMLVGYGKRSGVAPYELFFKNGQLIAQFTTANGFADLTANVQANVTYDAVATYDGSTARLYLNGTQAASKSLTGALSYVSGYGLEIGDDASYSSPAFNGTIGGVAVFAKTLSASQVSAHYAAVTSTPTKPAPTATPKPTPAPTATPAPTSAPSGTVIWKAGDATLGKWITANTYQCGNPVNTGSTFTFNLAKSGTSCGRNMANPENANGSAQTLTDGATYTWSFHYVDGKPDGTGPGMGLDSGTDPEALIWQIHGLNENDTPCTSLNFLNGSYYSGSVGAGQQWALMTCAGPVWYGKYTPGETDDFKIVATIANADIAGETYGDTKLYRNGVLVVDAKGPNYHHSTSSPAQSWWNFGPYKWRWELSNSGSSMTSVNATFENFIVTKQ